MILPAAATVAAQLKKDFPADPEVLFAAWRVYSDLADEAVLDLSLAAPQSAQMHQAMAHVLIRERDNKAAIENLREASEDQSCPSGSSLRACRTAQPLHAACR